MSKRSTIIPTAAAVGLLIAGASLAAWASTQARPNPESSFGPSPGLRIGGGWLLYGQPLSVYEFGSMDEDAPPPHNPPRPAPRAIAAPGFRIHLNRYTSSYGSGSGLLISYISYVAVHLAWPAAVGVGLAGLSVASLVYQRRRITAGRCPVCGYDLRATPERCPECGTSPTV